MPKPRVEGAREREILLATLQVLGETGYDRLTLDLVAIRTKAGKATLYRRWASKAALVAEAVALLTPGEVVLPDTGSLGGDLLALTGTVGFFDTERARLACGLTTALYREPELHDVVRRTLLDVGTAHVRALLARAVERGLLRSDVDLDLVCEVVPAMALFRLTFAPADESLQDHIRDVVEGLVLPALRPYESH